MKTLAFALVLLAAQTPGAGAYVVCNATPSRAACLGPRVGSNYGWRGPGWYRWRGAYGGTLWLWLARPLRRALWGWLARAPTAGAVLPTLARPAPMAGVNPYAGPYFRPGPYF